MSAGLCSVNMVKLLVIYMSYTFNRETIYNLRYKQTSWQLAYISYLSTVIYFMDLLHYRFFFLLLKVFQFAPDYEASFHYQLTWNQSSQSKQIRFIYKDPFTDTINSSFYKFNIKETWPLCLIILQVSQSQLKLIEDYKCYEIDIKYALFVRNLF